jgi:hypothetical protein
MNMICHYTPGKYFKALVLLTIPQTFNNNIFVIVSCKNINPFVHGKRNKINSIRIIKLVFPAHWAILKVIQRYENQSVNFPERT